MSHILHPPRTAISTRLTAVTNPATYQTNPNPSEHSKLNLVRLTLVTLWNLRVPPMVRTAFIVLLLVPFLASSAGASRIDTARTGTHASVKKSTAHRAHRSAHSVSRSSRTTSTHTAARTSKSHAASRRSVHYPRSSRHSAYTARRISGVRRARYTGHSARARFTPLATVSVSRRQTRSHLETDSGTPDPSSDAASTEPAPESPSEPDAVDHPAPAEGDVALSAGADASAAAAAGNPLAAPPVAAAVPAATGQIAELRLPHFPQNLHINSYALRGTHDSLVRQNERVEEESLERIEDDADLQDRIARGMLVRVPESAALSVNPDLPDDRRYCRPWTANFLTDLSRAHNSVFHKPLVVSSAVRTVEYQKRLMRTNHNAADAEGDIVSPHLTGATIDIAKSGLSRKEMQWMRNELLAYQNAGVLDVEEEFHQRCFHITVYKDYDSVTHHQPATDAATPAPPASLPAGPGDTATRDQ